jgi:hypothetical protein
MAITNETTEVTHVKPGKEADDNDISSKYM